MLGVAGTSGMFGFNVQATQALKDLGVLGFRGVYTKNQSADFTAFGLDARLDKTPIGPVSIITDNTKSGDYKAASLGIGKPIGPGVAYVRWSSTTGRPACFEARYTANIRF